MEEGELRALGFSDKADTWKAALHSQRAKRQQMVQERAAKYKEKEFERSTMAAEAWVEGRRLRVQLGCQPSS